MLATPQAALLAVFMGEAIRRVRE
ncbi:protein of unknown function [Azospirillum lipoferum 4B]|uniref:Uncharacterized protein n=1 Tax=Azospirillum lipoferum (strain 4B) TaxID=862719 RepID=G7Z3Q0_AZOL4|nr:protein of unknown function [Azospirillum lipoferum 4B]